MYVSVYIANLSLYSMIYAGGLALLLARSALPLFQHFTSDY